MGSLSSLCHQTCAAHASYRKNKPSWERSSPCEELQIAMRPSPWPPLLRAEQAEGPQLPQHTLPCNLHHLCYPGVFSETRLTDSPSQLHLVEKEMFQK